MIDYKIKEVLNKGFLEEPNITIKVIIDQGSLKEKLVNFSKLSDLEEEFPEFENILNTPISELDDRYKTLFTTSFAFDGNKDFTLKELLIKESEPLSQRVPYLSVLAKDGHPIGWICCEYFVNALGIVHKNIISNIDMLAFKKGDTTSNKEFLWDVYKIFNDLVKNHNLVQWDANIHLDPSILNTYDHLVKKFKGTKEVLIASPEETSAKEKFYRYSIQNNGD